MKPADVFLAVLVAVTWGVGFVGSRLALDELSPALMTAMRFAIAALPCISASPNAIAPTTIIAPANVRIVAPATDTTGVGFIASRSRRAC